jgi:hypothetical protein
MANRHIKELSKKVKTYFEKLNRLDNMAVKLSSDTMVDPDEWNEIVESIRLLSLHLANISSVLSMAEVSPLDFTSALNSRRTLVKSLNSVIERVVKEQPESELILGYKKALEDHKSTLELIEETYRFKSFPKSKKKFSKWNKRGLIDMVYKPFESVDKKISEIDTKLLAQVLI